MFYIVESDLQLQRLRSYKDKPCLVEAIPSNFYFHPKLTSTTALYIRPLDFSKGFIIPIDHEEGLNVDKTRVYDILKEYDKTWVSSKVTYRFNENYQLSIFYGSNKGGISCANGICRYYPGFSDGFRIQLTKSFY